MMQRSGYSLQQFAEMIGGTIVGAASDVDIIHLVTDSRQFTPREGAVFFALKGERNDGHNYVKTLADAGMKNFVLSNPAVAAGIDGINVIRVDDTLAALQKAGAAHRARFDIPVTAITGSNGKTVVKEWLFQLLQKKQRVMRSPRSYNSQIGVPLSAWLLGERHEAAIFEAGISKPGEMEKLKEIITPDTGIFTNIGPAHAENFKDITSKVNEKLKLFTEVERLIYCRDHREIDSRIRAVFSGKETMLRSWSLIDSDADLHIALERGEENTSMHCTYGSRKFTAVLPFTDAASIENAGHCIMYLLEAGHSDSEIAEGISGLTPIAMRLEQLDGINGCTLLNDVYNSDLASLEIALDQLKLQRKNKTFIAIVSDLVQTGEPPETLYPRVAELIALKGADRFIGIGPDISSQQEAFKGIQAEFYPDTSAFLRDFKHGDYRSANILIKGARRFSFERITSILSEKTHETILEIDLERLRENLDFLRSRLNPDTKIMVMVKAFSYGSGAYEIARTLEFYGTSYLAVAYADEGISLREAGITMPIMVLNPEISTYDAMIRYRLEPQIFSFLTLEKFTQALFAREGDWPFPIHIKINTGMNRLGFDPNEMQELGSRLAANDAVKPVAVFTHLAGSDAEGFDPLTEKQVARFEAAVAELDKWIEKPYMKHVLNSQGVLRHPQYQFDMVRVGLALYGLSGNPEFRKHLKPVSRLITTVSQVRHVEAGEGVGYNPKNTLEHPTEVAVIPVGYADGIPRTLGNGKGHVMIRDTRVPFVGNICMDMSMVDVTGVGCREGDKVEVFGDRMDVYEMADNLNTIPYEVLTSISQRVKRIYLHQ
ncbi:MAG: bifunctional UDP-N-acetylmuramoyl-tripeptide:D-alanyl-D-alanine ligase/alanine racemase [Flavobacteriales bacterium]|nr:bifunctional UDP-N-acetylmuramoyl-tripeptide:D-alanyl-D-alanine ligase/alanine racemase [Flavobacteriales bacterium]